MKSIVVIFFGLVFLGVGCFLFFNFGNILLRGEITKGVIIKKSLLKHPDGDRVYSIVRYKIDTCVHETEISNHTQNYDNVVIGDTVEVYYDKKNPQNIFINRNRTLGMVLLPFFIGLFVTFLGIYLYKNPKIWDYFDYD